MRLAKTVAYFFVLILPILGFQNNYYNTDLGKCGKVHLTISSLEGAYLELNWVTRCDQSEDVKPDKIALYDRNPLDRNDQIPSRIVIPARMYPDGYYRTKIKFGEPWLPGNWEYHENLTRPDPGQHCFPYWIASYRNNFTLDLQCLRISPTWMSDNSNHLGTQRIGNIFIPGTHNSGASQKVTFLNGYISNQDRDVWTQLVFGIRYLDFRIGYYNDGFYINHDVVRITKLRPVLKQIRKFAELAPKEIIVLDLHRFPYPTNFESSIHVKLLKLLWEELGGLTVDPTGFQSGEGPMLNDIWARNQSIILTYPYKDITRKNKWIWHFITQYWGNKRNVSDLKQYLDSVIKEHKTHLNPIWALMAELTPQAIDVILRTNNLRKLADSVNRHVTKWFRDEWLSNINVVATDFFLGNDIINVAIDRNING